MSFVGLKVSSTVLKLFLNEGLQFHCLVYILFIYHNVIASIHYLGMHHTESLTRNLNHNSFEELIIS